MWAVCFSTKDCKMCVLLLTNTTIYIIIKLIWACCILNFQARITDHPNRIKATDSRSTADAVKDRTREKSLYWMRRMRNFYKLATELPVGFIRPKCTVWYILVKRSIRVVKVSICYIDSEPAWFPKVPVVCEAGGSSFHFTAGWLTQVVRKAPSAFFIFVRLWIKGNRGRPGNRRIRHGAENAVIRV